MLTCLWTFSTGQWVGGRPCWLAQLRSPLNGELADDAAEAMDICDEVARRARAVGRKAKAQAEEFGDPAGHMQARLLTKLLDLMITADPAKPKLFQSLRSKPCTKLLLILNFLGMTLCSMISKTINSEAHFPFAGCLN